MISFLASESPSSIRRRLGRRRISEGASPAIFAPYLLSVLQLDIRSMGVRSLIPKHVSNPFGFALPEGPRSNHDGFEDDFPEEWLQDRDASADETGVDLDDAPDETLGVEVSHHVNETDDGDGPVSNIEKYKNQRADSCLPNDAEKNHGGGTGAEHTWSQS